MGTVGKMVVTDLQAYIGLLILTGVYKSKEEATASLWNTDTGRAIFPSTMFLKTFHGFSCVIRIDDKETRQGRQERDKLTAIREVLEQVGPAITLSLQYRTPHHCG